MNPILVAALVLIVLVAGVAFLRRRRYAHPRVAPRGRPLSLHEILAYASRGAPEVHVTTVRDVLPGGFAAAMVPVRIDWQESNPDDPDGKYVLRDVNTGSNPYGGTTVLRSVRIPARALEAVEYVVVPLDRFGHRGLIAHGMLRFVFRPDRPGVLLGADGREVGPGARFPDLVLSWEAWRPPSVPFDVRQGMDPSTFRLTLRAYTGHQRFLEDALGNRGWYAYPLQLPGGEEGLAEVLRTSLVLGDGAGRRTLAALLDEAEEGWLRTGAGDRDAATAEREWQAIQAHLKDVRDPGDPRLVLAGGKNTYQSLLRSCATMAFYAINVAVARLLERGVPAEGMRPAGDAELPDVPDWMPRTAGESMGRLLWRTPFVLGYLLRHPHLIPTQIPGRLDRAGLLVRQDGHPVMYRYDARTTTPYGRLGDALIE